MIINSIITHWYLGCCMSDNKVIVSINGEKIEHVIDSLSLNMPPEAAALLALMKSQTVISKVSETSLDLKSIIESNTKDLHNSSALIRKTPDSVAFALAIVQRDLMEKAKNEEDPVKRLMIDESGIALGIIVGITNKNQISEIMKKYTKNNPTDDGIVFFYTDLSLSIFFHDDIVSEMKFGNLYKGSTLKGLFIGDTVDQAIEIYGQPKMKSPKGVMWNKFAIFCEKNIITSIRIQK